MVYLSSQLVLGIVTVGGNVVMFIVPYQCIIIVVGIKSLDGYSKNGLSRAATGNTVTPPSFD